MQIHMKNLFNRLIPTQFSIWKCTMKFYAHIPDTVAKEYSCLVQDPVQSRIISTKRRQYGYNHKEWREEICHSNSKIRGLECYLSIV